MVITAVMANLQWAPTPIDLDVALGSAALIGPTVIYPSAPVDLALDIGGASLIVPLRLDAAPVDLALVVGEAAWAQTVLRPAPLDLPLDLGGAQANWPRPPITAAGLDLPVDLGAARVGIATRPGRYPTPDDEPGWTARVVTMGGDVIGDLGAVNAVRITEELNAETRWAMAVPRHAPGADLLVPLAEVQIWRDGDLVCWGPILARSAASSDGLLVIQGADPWWYIMRRYFGTAGRINRVRNGSFEVSGRWSARACTYTRVTSPAFDGSRSARLDCPEAGRRAWISQTFTPPPLGGAGGPRGTLAVTAWVWIDPGQWIGPAADSIGIELAIHGPRARSQTATLDANTDRGEWVPLTVRLAYTTADQGAAMTVRLYAPGGRVWWDSVVAAVPENTSTGPAGVDQATWAGWVIGYAQSGRGKTSVEIGAAGDPTGVTRVRRWLHADHDPITDAIGELVEADDGIDWSLDLTPTTRTFRTWYPRMGRDLTGGDAPLVLRPGLPSDGGTIASWRWSDDVADTATSVVALGPGAGTTRLEGGATSDALDGLVLEHVARAPEGITATELDPWAQATLGLVEQPARHLAVTSHTGVVDVDGVARMIHHVRKGDLVEVDIDDGAVQLDGTWRITGRELSSRPETVTLTLTPWEA